MNEHERERGTADWLAGEFGSCGRTSAYRRTKPVRKPRSPRHRYSGKCRTIREDRFFTEAEQDRLEDVDPAQIREALRSAECKRRGVNPEALHKTRYSAGRS